MKLIEKITPIANKCINLTRKHSPDILLVGGVVGLVGGTVMACVASTKVKDINEDHKQNLEKIHKKYENAEKPEEIHERKKEVTKAYLKTSCKYIRLYAPSIILWTLSAGEIIGSNKIMKQRNAALAAAYATVDKGFKEYRNRVAEKFGDDVEKQIRYNTSETEVTKEEPGKDGKIKTVKKKKQLADREPSMYARYFEEYTKDENGNCVRNWNWKKDAEMNLYFLKCQQNLANAQLKAKGMLFLNDVYEMLGLPKTKAGQIVGWINDPAFTPEDRHVDFGIFANADDYGDFVNYNDAILLDFNVAGNVWDLMNDF